MYSEDIPTSYHLRTKHHLHRFAASLGYMDWDHQPDPFRRYAGAALHLLPFRRDAAPIDYDELFVPGAIPPRSVDRQAVGELFAHALGLSAWKEYGAARWELRCNPSSGNLHPTEGYAVLGPIAGIAEAPGVYHYSPKEHGLEQRCAFEAAVWHALVADLPPGSFLVGLASIHWREAWKYGERAYRYCQHDCGHAIGALSFSAAALGWRLARLDELGDREVAALLGLDRDGDYDGAEREHPDCMLAVIPGGVGETVSDTLSDDAIDGVARGAWTGRANALSSDHVDWAVIPEVAEGCTKPATEPRSVAVAATGTKETPATRGLDAHALFLQRRSAVDMDGETGIGADAFSRMLRRTRPAPLAPPWTITDAAPRVHLALFVHRVDGLAPGLYLYLRDDVANAGNARPPHPLAESLGRDFAWEAVPGIESLYLLERRDYRRIAAGVSCSQAIAGDGAFSLGMIAAFARPLADVGPWMYPRLFWECGQIGQALYLEAEAAGVRSTGIGCYLDDEMHQLLGLDGTAWQSLYHFTVGGPVDDPRLRTLPPYGRERLAED